jgi:predicted ATPase
MPCCGCFLSSARWHPAPMIRRRCSTVSAPCSHLGTEHPLLWLIDDLHWADRSTRELLGFLARTLRACRVLVVTAYRADDLDRGHPLRPVPALPDGVRAVARGPTRSRRR